MPSFYKYAALLLLVQSVGYSVAEADDSLSLGNPQQEKLENKDNDSKSKSTIEKSDVGSAHLWQKSPDAHMVGDAQNMRQGWNYEISNNPSASGSKYNLYGVPQEQAARRFDTSVKPFSTYQTWQISDIKSDQVKLDGARNMLPSNFPVRPLTDSIKISEKSQTDEQQMMLQSVPLQQQLDSINSAYPSSIDAARQMSSAQLQNPTGEMKPVSYYSKEQNTQPLEYRAAPGIQITSYGEGAPTFEYRSCSGLYRGQDQQMPQHLEKSSFEHIPRQKMSGFYELAPESIYKQQQPLMEQQSLRQTSMWDQNVPQTTNKDFMYPGYGQRQSIPQQQQAYTYFANQQPFEGALNQQQRQSIPMLAPNQQMSTFTEQVPQIPQIPVAPEEQQQRQLSQQPMFTQPQQMAGFFSQMPQAPNQPQQQRQLPMFIPTQQPSTNPQQAQQFSTQEQRQLLQPQQPMLNHEQQSGQMQQQQQMPAFTQRQLFTVPVQQQQPQQQQSILPQQSTALWGEQEMPQHPAAGFQRQMSQQQEPQQQKQQAAQIQMDVQQTQSSQPQIRAEDASLQPSLTKGDDVVTADDQAKLDEMRAAMEETPEARTFHLKKKKLVAPNIYINLPPSAPPRYTYAASSYAAPSYGGYGGYAGGYAPITYTSYREANVGATKTETADDSKQKTSMDVTTDSNSDTGSEKTQKEMILRNNTNESSTTSCNATFIEADDDDTMIAQASEDSVYSVEIPSRECNCRHNNLERYGSYEDGEDNSQHVAAVPVELHPDGSHRLGSELVGSAVWSPKTLRPYAGLWDPTGLIGRILKPTEHLYYPQPTRGVAYVPVVRQSNANNRGALVGSARRPITRRPATPKAGKTNNYLSSTRRPASTPIVGSSVRTANPVVGAHLSQSPELLSQQTQSSLVAAASSSSSDITSMYSTSTPDPAGYHEISNVGAYNDNNNNEVGDYTKLQKSIAMEGCIRRCLGGI